VSCIIRLTAPMVSRMILPTGRADIGTETTSSRHGWISFGIVSVAVYVSLLDTFIVNLAFPAIGASFPGTGLGDLSWVFTGYAIVFAGLLVPAGRIADAVGHKRLFLIGLGLFVLASAASAAAPSPLALIVARIVQGAGAALFTPTALAVVLPEFPPQRRVALFGAYAAVGAVGAASGPLLGAVLVESNWRWIFLVNIPVGLASLIFGARWLRESRDQAGWRMPDLIGTAALIVGVGALALTISKIGEWGLSSTTIVSAVLAVGSLLYVFYRSRRHHTPALEIGLLRRRTFLFAVSAALLFGVGFAAAILAGAQFLTLQWHQSILLTGLAMSPGPIMAAAVAIPAARKLGPRYGQHRVGAAGCLLAACGAVWLVFWVGAEHQYFTDFLPAQILTGLGVGMAIPSFTAATLSTVEPARLSTAIGIASTFQQNGNALGAAAFVSIVGTPQPAEAVSTFHHGWIFIAAVQVIAATVMLKSRKRVRGDGAP
jgi:EmrB/QacA subfamily drug resistance transporter